MELIDLRYFIACADTGKLSHAAKAFDVEPSTVSRRISNLEDEFGLSLFERDHGGIRLTSGGQAIVVHARRILSEIDTLKRVGTRYASGRVGEIRLGVRIPPIGEPARSLLRDWRTAHPDVALTVREGNERDVAIALMERHLDVALIAGRTIWPSVTVLPLYRERLLAAIPADHLLATDLTLNWSSLCRETILVEGWDDNQAPREFYAWLLGNACDFQVHAASKQTILALVGAGAGVTLVTQSLAEATCPGVVFKPIDEENAWLEFDLVWPADAEDPLVGRFIAFMRDQSRLRGLL
ncbi:MAG: LysR family transcriptional regulator [Alphaproteobacteria bacterium]|nr:LysR family transcriptional regulator [Alphaproteobacteria bacterium]MBL7097280.1 LysR family transcriptional regulator [Alphaproteobacteria bacterium]